MTVKQDGEWLKQQFTDGDPTMAQVEKFSERVSIMVIDGGVPVDKARELALKVVGMAA
ncbi:MAG: hypothetical protein ACXWT0_00100 [Methylobacter sp.]